MAKWLSYLSPEPLGVAYTPERAWQEASAMYDRLHQQAKRARVRAVLTRHPAPSLLVLDEQGALARSRLPEYRTIPLAQIRGTEGRQADFDAAFRPLHPQMRVRWQGVAQAYLLGEGLPPIEVIQIGDSYYVRDGHHRVSVALALGQTDIEAQVTIWTAPAPALEQPRDPCVDCPAPLAA